ncbi:serine/threonine kinase [Pyrodictium delaneyi]|uniref:non-specific serine/threonine protein kinase n=1 Tax=Pyrodictium delaneyi TaxID=1273541 RepID=A0A0P0N1M4_9CREN|nr:serine/threonine kinase [Pyrodictium delaneyi]
MALEGLEELGEPQYKGAEAYVYIVEWLGKKAVLKLRVPKTYRHYLLDKRLRWRRTINEARTVLAALELGVNAPAIYYVNPVAGVIVMEYIDAPSLYEIIEAKPEAAKEYARRLGEAVGILHETGISHGDLTTSNVLVKDGEVYLIDFGLASLKSSEREQAVDVHLYMRSLESTHPEHVDSLLEAFLEGYSSTRGSSWTEKIMQLVREIRLMGRYREERRTAWRQEE